MIRIANAQLWVHDQDEALAFYTEKLGWEVRVDATVPELGNFRWLTVGPASQQDFAVVLMAVPGPPMVDDETGDVLARAEDRLVASAAGIVAMKATTVGLRASSKPEKRASDLYDLGRLLVAGDIRPADLASAPAVLLDAVAEYIPLLVHGEEGTFQNKVHLAINPPPEKPPKKETN